MYKIKQVPEDFCVWEIPIYNLDEDGNFCYFWLRKTNYNTMDAVKQIARKLNLPLRYIGFAGSKDRQAVTEQVISVWTKNPSRVEDLNLKDIELSFIGKGDKPVSLGDLKGNSFRIVVRNLPKRLTLKNPNKVPNLFGPQRFSKNNAQIGKALVDSNFQKAIDLIDQKYVKEYLDDHPGDLIGAFRELPLRLRKLYIHSYQSFLWNKTVEEYLKQKPVRNESIPIVGFQTELGYDKISTIVRKIIQHEDLQLRDFIIKQIPEISSEGGERDLFIAPENFDISEEKDELNENRFKAVVTFSLPKGSYATVVIDHLFQLV